MDGELQDRALPCPVPCTARAHLPGQRALAPVPLSAVIRWEGRRRAPRPRRAAPGGLRQAHPGAAAAMMRACGPAARPVPCRGASSSLAARGCSGLTRSLGGPASSKDPRALRGTGGNLVPRRCIFCRNVGPRMSRRLPRDRFFVLSRFLTVPGPVEGPWGPEAAKHLSYGVFSSSIRRPPDVWRPSPGSAFHPESFFDGPGAR